MREYILELRSKVQITWNRSKPISPQQQMKPVPQKEQRATHHPHTGYITTKYRSSPNVFAPTESHLSQHTIKWAWHAVMTVQLRVLRLNLSSMPFDRFVFLNVLKACWVLLMWNKCIAAIEN